MNIDKIICKLNCQNNSVIQDCEKQKIQCMTLKENKQKILQEIEKAIDDIIKNLPKSHNPQDEYYKGQENILEELKEKLGICKPK